MDTALNKKNKRQTVIIHDMLRMLGYIRTFKLAQFQGKQPKQGFIVCKMFLKHHKFQFVKKGKTQTTSLKSASSSKPRKINQNHMSLDSYITAEFKTLSDSTTESAVQLYLLHIWLLCVINLALSRMQS